jgi:hypothetical protein
MIRIFISQTKAETLDEARKKTITKAKFLLDAGQTLTSAEVLDVNIREMIGRDFFLRSGDASPPPPSKVLSMDIKEGKWKIEIESAVTGEKATLELDTTFKLQKAFRNGKQVYPDAEKK